MDKDYVTGTVKETVPQLAVVPLVSDPSWARPVKNPSGITRIVQFAVTSPV
jgi:hypothetical protein